MGRTKLTQEQEDLIAVLPLAITKSEVYKKLTDAQRLVLAQIDLQDGTDFSAENDYVFRSNKTLMKDTGISSEHTVIEAVRRLVNEGLITTKRGFRNKEGRKASEYVLTDKYYELCDRKNPHTELQYMYCNNKNHNSNCSTDIELEPEPEKDIKNMMEYTCTGEDNSKNQHNMKINEDYITENEKDAWEILNISDDFDYTQYEDISRQVQHETRSSTYFEKKKNNDYVSDVFKKLKYYISEYKKSTSVEMANYWGIKVNNLYGSLERSLFSDSQWKVISNMIDEFDILYEHKEMFLSKKYHKSNMMKKKSVTNENATKKVVADEDNEMMLRAYCTDEELEQMGFVVNEPVVVYNQSVYGYA